MRRSVHLHLGSPLAYLSMAVTDMTSRGTCARWALSEVEVVSGIVLKSARKRQQKDDSIKVRPIPSLLPLTLLAPRPLDSFPLRPLRPPRKPPGTPSPSSPARSSSPASPSPARTHRRAPTRSSSTRSSCSRSQRTKSLRIDTCWLRMRRSIGGRGRGGRRRRGKGIV